jgi:SAM-dependent methyltransferase
MLLLAAGLNLRDGDLQDVNLEAPVGIRRRIDVEVGATVFEVKRDLRAGNVRSEAVGQLADYVRTRAQTMGARYVGVLTDGVEWQLYHLDDGHLREVSAFTLDPRTLDVDGLVIWLDGVLATADKISPTPAEIRRRLGAGSTAHALDVADLLALYHRFRDHPSVALKRQLWAKLLTTALGTSFADEDDLFVEHTLLVATAEIIGHAVVGFDPTDASISPATLLAGHLFVDAQIRGVVEADFFDWIVEVDGGSPFVRTLARRLARFRWVDVEHDVMKVLYESVIAPDTRHRLGEYYTPDWLAEAIVAEAVEDPLTARVLDPACGSGTFLFYAVRHYLAAAAAAGVPTPAAITGVTSAVLGLDVHPVAVTLARVTYLLALGRERLTSNDRPAFSVPVYLGDSVQWGQDDVLINYDALIVPTNDGAQLFADDLRFPDRVVEDAARFDGLVAELADMAALPNRSATPPSLSAVFRRYAIREDEQPVLMATFATMCRLHDEGRDHIWGYYLRNLARPLWLSRPDNQVDVLVGNPPWLSYRFMPPLMKDTFRTMSTARGFWAGAAVATHQDLSALFVARSVQQYLKADGRFAFVMPLAVLSRRQFAGFRTGTWGISETGVVNAAFEGAWDLHQVKPSFFPVPAAVVLGRQARTPVPLTGPTEAWAGRLRGAVELTSARAVLTRRAVTAAAASTTAGSPYAPRFSQGATLVPRFLLFVEDAPANPLGAGAGRRAVRSKRVNNEKRPWKSLPGLTGSVERQFIRPTLVGDSVLPFRLRPPQEAIIPSDGTSIQATIAERLDRYPGLAQWWREAARVWEGHKSAASTLRFLDQIDYRHKLRDQLPGSPIRVVYSASGMYLAAAILDNPSAVIEHKLYWAAVESLDEARYLVAVLNSGTLLRIVQPLQARGEHNPRDFDKYVWRAPIPLYDASSALHRDLVEFAVEAEQVAQAVDLPQQSFQALRRRVRGALDEHGLTAREDQLVADLLSSTRTI